MIYADKYRNQKDILMDEYEKTVRQWMSDRCLDNSVVNHIPFFEDGIVCPEKWFEEGNEFRPLFILKETSIGIDSIIELEDYYQKWKTTRFDHVGDKFGDIRIGVNRFKGNNPWLRIVRLAYGLKTAYETREFLAYEDVEDISFIRGEANPDNVSGDPIYDYATANENYISMVNKIAVVNIKKIAGGTTTKSEISKQTMDYSKHLTEELAKLLYKEITELINPSVIIFCSPDISYIMGEVYGDSLLKNYICVEGYHPTMTSTEKFYNNPIRNYITDLENMHENMGRQS